MKSDGDEYNDEYMSNFGIQRSTYGWAPLKYTNISKFSLMEFRALFFPSYFAVLDFIFLLLLYLLQANILLRFTAYLKQKIK